MFFLNLTLFQLAALAGGASLFALALYLLDRSRHRQVVSTLLFWASASRPVQTARRRHIRQPLSLILQLLGIILLSLAIAEPHIGNPFNRRGAHILVLETSAWMGAGVGGRTLMSHAHDQALRWLRTVPGTDRVMLIRADSLATPATPFEDDHSRIQTAIERSEPGSTSLDLGEALRFARRTLAVQRVSGDITFIGSGRVGRDADLPTAADAAAVRAVLIQDNVENSGIRRISLRRSAMDASQWDVLLNVRHYGAKHRAATIAVWFNQSPVGAKRLQLNPGEDQEVSFSFHSTSRGVLQVRLSPPDNFPDDDRAELQVPADSSLAVTVYTRRPDLLRPFFVSAGRVLPVFRLPEQFRADDKGLVVLDGFRPGARPENDTIWIDPPAGNSPVSIARTVGAPKGMRWTSSPLSAGLRSHDADLGSVSIFRAGEGDIVIAEVEDGPILLARPGLKKTVVIGFDPTKSGLRYQISTPLVFANILRWMGPETFRQSDVTALPAGFVSANLETRPSAGELRVVRADGSSLPFTLDGKTLRFFAGSRETIRAIAPQQESVFSLTLPAMWSAKWEPPSGAPRGIPSRRASALPIPPQIWPWLAALGGGCLLAEWIFYGRGRQRGRVHSLKASRSLRRAS